MNINSTEDIVNFVNGIENEIKTNVSNFSDIEIAYNKRKEELNNERKEFLQNSTLKFDKFKSDYLAKIDAVKKQLSDGVFLPPILENEACVLTEKARKYLIAMWIIIIIFILFMSFVIIAGTPIYFLVMGVIFFGIIILPISNQHQVLIDKTTRINSFKVKNVFNAKDFTELREINKNLSKKIDEGSVNFKIKTENELILLAQRNEIFLKGENEKNESELTNLEIKIQIDTKDLEQITSRKIDEIKSRVDEIYSQLNRLPETFNEFDVSWNDPEIIRGNGFSVNQLRIAEIETNIIINSIKRSILSPVFIKLNSNSNVAIYGENVGEINKSIKISHNLIARILLAVKPDKIRITFFDPLELGGNAAPFTPLLRQIYGGVVFTQPSDLEEQLSVLTRAIENVIQKYLQDKFKDIRDYNNETNEVPEPNRLLVIYNFPHGFNETTAKKLLNVIKSGPKAGVNTILVIDRNAKIPFGWDWKYFQSLNMAEIWLDNDIYSKNIFKFDNDLPYSEIVEYVNKELPNASSIKVSYAKYIESEDKWWREKAHKFYAVPIGRHALEVQNLRFDNDDDNQALLIGKPGSGKSNLLHVIILNSLWKYSPDQLEIYLIDFKGGVEFTIYADKKIPHIRTIAIESEREFGLSVLDGVEKELIKREIEFAKSGVQNIEQFHNKYPEQRMPRVLLIVDEFQEFFAEDDAIKQAVDDKFDRIVRKGRAFGINTLLSSQTLSGNSIKKSTKDLIDIRIALMCSDIDSTQILSDRNPAAKDLTRPGEGIYNAENGKVEGNKKFQAFFLENEEITKTIESIVEFSNKKGYNNNKFRQIIFRGSEKALIQKNNHPLTAIKALPSPKYVRIWFGEPVAISDDVSGIIRKQGGSNLLIAGFDESIGLRVMVSSIISIAKQHNPKSCKFYSFNYYNIDSNEVNVANELFDYTKQDFVLVKNRQEKEMLNNIKLEIEKRLSGNSDGMANMYLTFFSFQRGRSFRLDNFENSEINLCLSFILKEGPDVGIFILMQVDTMENLYKNMSYNLISEFTQRVASQMNPDNSVKIIGNQKAARLGDNRAYYYDDNENILIKFKPYELPQLSWINELLNPQSSHS